MTARLVRLRIAGFKSFAEPVSLDILPGLTGIVGPNGCGKSNVADALRWAMAETSARSLRGGEMDDVIFAGTNARASRNLAEVSVSLAAGDAPFPSPFEAEAELQITRRIERGAGSGFRANGRELRARDVQTLYADLGSGARSSGMVGQGRVAALVRARPEERRQVLEEAAGIAGLHARRHEAELKLRAAEQNLGRADDAQVHIETARNTLQRQARQAARYRASSELIRVADSEHLAVLQGRAAAARDRALTAMDAARTALAVAAQTHETAVAALADAEAGLPQPRQTEAEARSVLERRRLEAESLAAAAARAQAEHAAAIARHQDLSLDLAASERACVDAQHATAHLEAACDRLVADHSTLPARLCAAAEASRLADIDLQGCRAEAEAASEAEAAASTQLAYADAALRETILRAAHAQDRHGAAQDERAAASGSRVPQGALDAAGLGLVQAQAALDAAHAALDAAEAARVAAASRAAEACLRAAGQRAIRQQAEQALASCAARLADAEAACSESASMLARLEGERAGAPCLSDADGAAELAEAALAVAEDEIDAAERAAGVARQTAAERRHAVEAGVSAARDASAARTAADAKSRQLADQAIEAREAFAAAAELRPTASELQHALNDLALAKTEFDQAARAARGAELALVNMTEQAARAQNGLARADAHAMRLGAEADGLAAALGPEPPDGVLSGLDVPPGLEAAVGAALGIAAQASLDPKATSFWRALAPIEVSALPAGTAMLAGSVEAPGALDRALSHAVLLDDAADGYAVQAALAPGMVAVDRAGGCWRWDGYVVRAGAPNPAAARLVLRRRLASVSNALPEAEKAAAQAALDCTSAVSAALAAQTAAMAARDAVALASSCKAEAVTMLGALESAARERDATIELRRQAVQRSQAELTMAERALAAKAAACEAVSAPDAALLAGLDAEVLLCEAALGRARDARLSCRARAVDTRRVAQRLAGEAARVGALIQATASTMQRAVEARDAARRDLPSARSALDDLPDLAELDAACTRVTAAEQACRAAEEAARATRRSAEVALEDARHAAATVQLAHGEAETRFASLSDLAARAAADLQAVELARAAAEQSRDRLPDMAALRFAAQTARARLEAAGLVAAEAQAGAAALDAALARAAQALPAATADCDAWRSRLAEATSRHAGLARRHVASGDECATLAARPAGFVVLAEQMQLALTAAAAAHAQAATMLDSTHDRVRTLAGAERDAAREAGACREILARAQADLDIAASAAGDVAARIAERLGGAAPLRAAADLSDTALDRAARRMERLVRERTEMGPVNLRAELEMAELDERLAALVRDRDELTAAIAKLRGAIGHLNREGRDRLRTVFSQVDQHFRVLFTRMMGGGRAQLAWTGSEDPLEAGLDILAEPPGKKLTSLSLLSGGEQALTALSLIFAVFRCQPAPVCVLDEVDAPLDDANVDRFCTLLDDMARETCTSFLVVTHHQLTMSRMDRLYGVTMQERGVSRVLSVGLSSEMAKFASIQAAAE